MPDEEIAQTVLSHIDENREEIIQFLRKLVSFPSVTGDETGIQKFIAKRLEEMDLHVDVWEPDHEELKNHPAYVPVEGDYKDRPNVVGVYKGSTEVASGSLGSGGPLYLPEGDYRVELHSSPPQSMPVSLSARDSVMLTLEKSGGAVSHFERRDRIEYRSCEDMVARIERLEAGQQSLHSATEEAFPSNAD